MMAGFSLVVLVSSGLPVAWILRLSLYITPLLFHLPTLVLALVSLNSFAVGQTPVTVPPSPFYLFFVLLLFWAV